jgi:mono/diheme cytochrome c family protein
MNDGRTRGGVLLRRGLPWIASAALLGAGWLARDLLRPRPVEWTRRPEAETVAPRPEDTERRTALRERLRTEMGDAYDAPLPAATPAQIARGSGLWEVLCAGCHATDARGRRTLSQMLPVPPGDLTDPERAAFYSDAARLRIVAEGIDGTPMFAWRDVLGEEDLFAVTSYLLTLVREE